MTLNYSIVLRTLGYGGPKYQALLDSIKSQTVQPAEFLVAIPPEYDLPQERLGTETFIRGPKGMVRQRIDGIQAAKGDYLLIVDDDVEFPPDFVENLWQLMQRAKADAVSPRVEDEAAPRNADLLNKIMAWLGSGARESNSNSPYALRISPLGGTIRQAPLNDGQIYYTQTGHGGCCFISRAAAQSIAYDQELWLEQGVHYAYPDDQVFFYKAYCLGLSVAYANSIPFHHLNAASSMLELEAALKKKCTSKHDACRNLLIFWHRFQYSLLQGKPLKRCLSTLGMAWKISFNLALHLAFYGWRPSHWCCISATVKGYRDGFSYLMSAEYDIIQREFRKQLSQNISELSSYTST